MNRRVLLIVGLVLIVIIAVVIILTRIGPLATSKPTTTTTPVIQTTNIIFAAQDIPMGAVITEDALQEGPWPSNIKMENLVTSKDSIVGKRARINLKRGEPVLLTSVIENGVDLTEAGSYLAFKIAPGKVAIAVPMSRLSGVAYGIRNGDHVMVIASMVFVDLDTGFQSLLPNSLYLIGPNQDGLIVGEDLKGGRCVADDQPICDDKYGQGTYVLPSEPQRGKLVSAVVVANARVLNVGTVGSEPKSVAPQPAGSTQTTTTATTQPPDVLVIEVTPEEAISLDFIIRIRGDLTYALRAAGDTTPISLPSWDLKQLLENRKIDPPRNLPYGPSGRVDQPYIPILGNDVVVEAR